MDTLVRFYFRVFNEDPKIDFLFGYLFFLCGPLNEPKNFFSNIKIQTFVVHFLMNVTFFYFITGYSKLVVRRRRFLTTAKLRVN